MNKHYLWLVLLAVITGCDQKTAQQPVDPQAVNALVQQSLENMVDIQGGSFMMGDFGRLVGEKLPFTGNSDDPLHKVALSDFAMGKYKVTFKEYDQYTFLTHQEKISQVMFYLDRYPKLRAEDMPAITTWQQARDYCQWLGKQTGKNIDLPTEGQWEYAARNRGKYVVFATDNGQYEPGRNMADGEQQVKLTGISVFSYPVGKYPPTPLGLYDMAGNGVDWIKDWYAEDYYQHSPELNPQGPDTGVDKVVRGYQGGGGIFTNQTMYRQFKKPDQTDKESGITPIYNFRCAINK